MYDKYYAQNEWLVMTNGLDASYSFSLYQGVDSRQRFT